VKVRFWGVRGSFATPGPEYLRYGGNTSAVEVIARTGDRLLLDLGTGVTELAKELMAGDFATGGGTLPILLTHTHIDHIQGLPFFTPFFIKGNTIRILGAESSGLPLSQTLQNQLNPHYSPLYGLENMAAGVSIEPIGPGTSLPVAGFEVAADLMPHGGMDVLSFRVTCDGATVVLMTDVEHPEEGPFPPAVALARDADLLIHDGMFNDEEYEARKGWGHSSVSQALAVAEAAGVGRLALFHHSPDAPDSEIDNTVAAIAARASMPVFGAAEGAPIDVMRRRPTRRDTKTGV
jgi:phosphoribosyl 1,2-cyclic phosphodiesterase